VRDSSTALISRRAAIAACASTLVGFIGLVHEFVGATIFPWAPAAVGGPIGWHTLGVAAIALGASMLLGALGLARIPVRPLGVTSGAVALVIFIATALLYREFHFFALAAFLAGAVAAAAAPEVACAHRR
jgi:hypothetical protein